MRLRIAVKSSFSGLFSLTGRSYVDRQPDIEKPKTISRGGGARQVKGGISRGGAEVLRKANLKPNQGLLLSQRRQDAKLEAKSKAEFPAEARRRGGRGKNGKDEHQSIFQGASNAAQRTAKLPPSPSSAPPRLCGKEHLTCFSLTPLRLSESYPDLRLFAFLSAAAPPREQAFNPRIQPCLRSNSRMNSTRSSTASMPSALYRLARRPPTARWPLRPGMPSASARSTKRMVRSSSAITNGMFIIERASGATGLV